MLGAGSIRVHSSGSLTQFTKKWEEPSIKQTIKMQHGECGDGTSAMGRVREGARKAFWRRQPGLIKD